jgi:hypothetical protein
LNSKCIIFVTEHVEAANVLCFHTAIWEIKSYLVHLKLANNNNILGAPCWCITYPNCLVCLCVDLIKGDASR